MKAQYNNNTIMMRALTHPNQNLYIAKLFKRTTIHTQYPGILRFRSIRRSLYDVAVELTYVQAVVSGVAGACVCGCVCECVGCVMILLRVRVREERVRVRVCVSE